MNSVYLSFYSFFNNIFFLTYQKKKKKKKCFISLEKLFALKQSLFPGAPHHSSPMVLSTNKKPSSVLKFLSQILIKHDKENPILFNTVGMNV